MRFADLMESDRIVIFNLEASDERFKEYLEISTSAKEGTWFNPRMEFTESELDRCDYFRPVCRGPVFKESDADYKQTTKYYESLSPVEPTPGHRVKLFDRLWVKARKLRGDTIAGAKEWLGEYIFPREVADIFDKSDLQGYEWKEVVDRKAKKPFAHLRLLYTNRFMPKAQIVVHPPKPTPFAARMGETMRRVGLTSEQVESVSQKVESEDRRERLYGCVCYKTLPQVGSSGFFRTIELWGGAWSPLWVVSRKVHEVYREHRMRGWVFRPILEEDSELFQTHKELWEQFFHAIRVNPANYV